jgi:hypothetical protein
MGLEGTEDSLEGVEHSLEDGHNLADYMAGLENLEVCGLMWWGVVCKRHLWEEV